MLDYRPPADFGDHTRPFKTLRREINEIELSEVKFDLPEFEGIKTDLPELDEIKIDRPEFKELKSHQTEVNEIERDKSKRRYQQRSAAMAAGLTDHI
jgi:hypothetical protein